MKIKTDEPKRLQHEKKFLLIYADGEKIDFDEPHKQSFYDVPLSDTSKIKIYKDGEPFKLKKSYPSYTAFWKHLAGIE